MLRLFCIQLLLLTLLVVEATAVGSVRLDLHHGQTNINRPYPKRSAALSRPRPAGEKTRAERLRGAVNTPLDDAGWYDESFQINGTLGTPPQNFNFTIDTYWTRAFVFAAGWPLSPIQCEMQPTPPRRFFSTSDSSTFVDTGIIYSYQLSEPYVNECGLYLGNWNDSTLAFDTLNIASTNLKSAPFVLTRNSQTLFDWNWPSDAILGIGTNFDRKNNATVIEKFLSTFDQSYLTFYLKSLPTVAGDLMPGGAITFGGKDTDNCASQWSYANIKQDANYGWHVNIDSLTVGNYKDNQKLAAVFLSSSTFIYAPPTRIDHIAAELNAEYDYATDRYTIACDKISTFPDMVFRFNGIEYHVPATDYARRIGVYEGNECTLMITENDVPDYTGSAYWMFGTTFSRAYCTLFDYDSYRIGFAKAKQTTA